ncbi:hypothetical protein MNV_480030 [Candidatus Methanoperedens nitroreducens]|uniref:Uncharacterized protein n=1 Tax=Candidatus Methanoperedens nitratireducens TaxID=1392998 RepID=A0A284VR31_9EURY|nr:hypothetical protein MNV_480030 [Candidatus Methanoperedens nitroreducens]
MFVGDTPSKKSAPFVEERRDTRSLLGFPLRTGTGNTEGWQKRGNYAKNNHFTHQKTAA